MIENIECQNETLALILRHSFDEEGVNLILKKVILFSWECSGIQEE
jgi:hypothetical protein